MPKKATNGKKKTPPRKDGKISVVSLFGPEILAELDDYADDWGSRNGFSITRGNVICKAVRAFLDNRKMLAEVRDAPCCEGVSAEPDTMTAPE